MGEGSKNNKAQVHVVCVPFPALGHIKPMLQLAKLLNSKGFHITFVNTEHSHRCLLNTWGPVSLNGTPTFHFETFPDGLPPSDTNFPRPVRSLVPSLEYRCREPFVQLLLKLNQHSSSGSPPITLIISDAIIPFTLDAAREARDLPIPVVFFTPINVLCFVAYSQFDTLLDRGIVPFKDVDYMTNGSLEVELDLGVPSMKGMRLKDLPSHIRTMDKNNPVFDYMRRHIARCSTRPMIFNTFEALDHECLVDLSTVMPCPVYTIGPLNSISIDNENDSNSFGSGFWKEDSQCLQWLDGKKPNSVVYVSFGSTTTMTKEELTEFAWGLANSNHPFLWVIRPDLVIGESALVPVEFENEVKGRGLLVSWCPQEKVLNHTSVAVFLTHSGWNSAIESISSGVPVICWPFSGDHQPISWLCCNKWGIGVQLNISITMKEVEMQIRKVMETDIGNQMKRKAKEWKNLSDEATSSNGSSSLDLERFINYVLFLEQQGILVKPSN